MNAADLKVGDHVHYDPDFGEKENGIVKSLLDGQVFVVYKCNGEWDRYAEYTGQNTDPKYLKEGWLYEKGRPR